MQNEQDDFDDPPMAELLRTWGNRVRDDADGESSAGDSVLFDPPPSLTTIRAALHEVDAYIDRTPASWTCRLRRAVWTRGRLAVAASLLLVATVWWVLRTPTSRDGAVSPASLALTDLRLSDSEMILRSESADAFHSGQDVFVHFRVDRPCSVTLAMLDSKMEFVLIEGEEKSVAPVDATPGDDNTLGITLDDNPGTETIVLLAFTEALPVKRLKRIIEEAAGSVGPEARTHEEMLTAILTALRSDPHLTVAYSTFEHRPARD